MPSPLALEDRVVDLLGAGVALVVGTANEAREPEVCRGWGGLWKAESGVLEVMLPLPAARSTLDNLARTDAVAFTFTKPTDYEAYQLKGARLEIRELRAEEWRRVRRQFDAFLAEASCVGLDPAAYAPWFPAEGRLLAARIEAAFSQAPGPKAGLAL